MVRPPASKETIGAWSSYAKDRFDYAPFAHPRPALQAGAQAPPRSPPGSPHAGSAPVPETRSLGLAPPLRPCRALRPRSTARKGSGSPARGIDPSALSEPPSSHELPLHESIPLRILVKSLRPRWGDQRQPTRILVRWKGRSSSQLKEDLV